MSVRRLTSLGAALLCLVIPQAVSSGPVFEDILNAMQLDQVMQRSGDDFVTFANKEPVGQTFMTGDGVVRVCRIALRPAWWHEDWQQDETLVVTLWDSPEKKTKLGSSFSVPHSRRMWQDGIMMFYVEADVQPNKQYYFEMTAEGGDGKLPPVMLSKFNIDYAGGAAYKGGQKMDRYLWFETHVKKTYDRDALYREFFDNFDLDHPGFSKVKPAVAAKDWDTACKEFLAHWDTRTDIMYDGDATPKRVEGVDTKEADLTAEQKFEAIDGSIVDLGPNWNYFATWPTLGGVGLTRTGLMKPLAFTYTKTGDEKYARAWNDMLICMFRNVPSPLRSGFIKGESRLRPTVGAGISGCLWDSISIAARLRHETFYNRFRKSPLFTPDARMAWWANMCDMSNLLERMDAGGNWTTQNTACLFGLGQDFPEFKKAKNWFAQGFEGLKQNFLDNMYPDGPCREAANYHGFSLGMFFDVLRRGKEMGLDVPKETMERLENAFEYSMYSTMPNGEMTMWGDSNRPYDTSGIVGVGGDYFNRDDMKWVSSKGKIGKKPSKASFCFPIAGYYMMRSGWDPEARFLCTRNGFSQSHYHSDQLSVQVNAYGVDLLPDMGIYAYGTPECNELVKTRSHSVVCVDDKDLLAGNGDNTFVSIPGVDYFDGTSPGYEDLKDVKHRRSILFLQPDYWVVADRVVGPGEHTAVQYWHLAPGKVDFDPATGAARTKYEEGGNLAVLPLYPRDRKNELTEGLYAISSEAVRNDAPVLKYERKGALPLGFCTVLFPYPVSKPAKVSAENLTCARAGVEALGAKINWSDWVDYVAFDTSASGAVLNPGNLAIAGQAGFVRTAASNGKVTKFALCLGTGLSFGGTQLASSDKPVRGLRVYYVGGTVTVDAEDAGPGLKVATLSASKAVVNGKAVKIGKGPYFTPFAD